MIRSYSTLVPIALFFTTADAFHERTSKYMKSKLSTSLIYILSHNLMQNVWNSSIFYHSWTLGSRGCGSGSKKHQRSGILFAKWWFTRSTGLHFWKNLQTAPGSTWYAYSPVWGFDQRYTWYLASMDYSFTVLTKSFINKFPQESHVKVSDPISTLRQIWQLLMVGLNLLGVTQAIWATWRVAKRPKRVSNWPMTRLRCLDELRWLVDPWWSVNSRTTMVRRKGTSRARWTAILDQHWHVEWFPGRTLLLPADCYK